jgi:carbon-monoxide dehydrogenase small subunit
MNTQVMELSVNGDTYEVAVDPQWTLLEVLREKLGLTGSKEGCGKGACGACTVLVNGEAVLACLTLVLSVEGKIVQTVEGLAKEEELTPLQNSFVANGAVQCGFCTPGMLMASTALLSKNPRPGEEAVKKALSGNLCRCTGYVKIVEAVMAASKE